jgi:succinate dehydrogenase/fumarate reductase flavoprotein subunit
LLTAGLTYLQRLKEKTHKSIIARNQHELMRCLEVLHLIDVGEITFVAANARRETRGLHTRADYPYTNPLLEKMLVVKKGKEGNPVVQWRELKR